MIDEDRTMQLFGYTSDELSHGSGKPVIVICERCGKYREICKRDYRVFCNPCAHSGENHYLFGKHLPVETKRKLSDTKMGTHATEESKHKMSIGRMGEKNHMYGRRGKESPLFGRHHSDETKKKMTESATGKTFSEEHCNNLSLSKAGKKLPPFTDDHKQKISASHQGIPYKEWEGFSTDKKYCEKFNIDCKEKNRDKYSRRCFLCGKPESENITSLGDHKKLSVHHVDMNKNQGCDGHDWHLVPLCINCHASRSHSDLWQARIEYLLKEIY